MTVTGNAPVCTRLIVTSSQLALTRISSGRVAHIDVAFPLNGDSTIDSVQYSIEVKKSF